MKRQPPTNTESLAMVYRIDPKFRPVWTNRPRAEQIALARYFLPHKSRKEVIEPTRPRAVKWYCPFACQSDFSSGHRYCINVYTGCQHNCVYCYAAAYQPEQAASKQNFEKLILKDMDDLNAFDVPPAPIHLSNSTDPLQPLEIRFRHTRSTLDQILEHRQRFTTVTVLTKNPLLPVQLGYIELFKALNKLPSGHTRMATFARRKLPGLCVEVSLAFWRDDARAAYDPGAPSVEERVEGLRALHRAGIPWVLRIDPLLPRSPLTGRPPRSMNDFGLPEAQTLDDLERLVAFAKEMQARHIVYSPCKIARPRGRKLSEIMQRLRDVYEHIAAPERLVFRGGSWRLPRNIAEREVTGPFLEICRRNGVTAKFCMENLIETQ